MLREVGIPVVYLVSAVLFILGLKQLSHPRTAPAGNRTAAAGMLVAVLATLAKSDLLDWKLIAGGILVGAMLGAASARWVQMTAMPQMVAAFNGFGGGASLLVAVAEYYRVAPSDAASLDDVTLSTIFLSVIIGAVTLTGSLVAYAKLQGIMRGAPIQFPGQLAVNALAALAAIALLAAAVSTGTHVEAALLAAVGVSLLLGVMMVIPIGGADMPVIISLLNSFSGLAAAATGFVISNQALIISGSLVGASGIILTDIMCKGMNRTIWNVLFAGVGTEEGAPGKGVPAGRSVKSYEPQDTVVIFENASKVMIVPGYGMAVAQAQHVVHELERTLEKKGVKVLYAIHPVAGRMPGHMNVLLAEANVSYDKLLDLDQANSELEDTEVAMVIGANDVVNPAARHDRSSPIYGMPILDVDKARTVFVLKRSMNPGFAGVDNELFYNDKTIMIFGDAKQTVSNLVSELK